MISRRHFFGLTSAGWLRAQDARPAVVLKVAVTDRQGGYINDLKPTDFRVFEDGIPQKIATFAKPAMSGGKTAGEAGKPGSGQETFESIREDLNNSYTITYYPDPSNHNEGFRLIKIGIIPDVDKQWRVRHRPGYRPNRL